MRPMPALGLALASAHLVRAAWAFAMGRADLGTVFDLATAGALAAASLLLGVGRARAATLAAAPVVVLKLLEALHAAAHLRAHGFAASHAGHLALAVALGGALLAAMARARKTALPVREAAQ